MAASIQEFGFKVPIIIDENNVIVAGHTRYRASQKLGLEEVPCIVSDDLTEAQVKAFRIADNKVSEFATWDEELLALELEQLSDMDFDLSFTGFEMDELKELMGEIEPEPDFDELEKDMDEKEKVIVQITFSDINEWKLNENELREVVENMNANIAVKMG